jgi:hypothetical protein
MNYHVQKSRQAPLTWYRKREPRKRPRRTHMVSGGVAQLFLNLGTRRGCVVSITPRPRLPPGKEPVPIVQEIGWAPEQVWLGAENLTYQLFLARSLTKLCFDLSCVLEVSRNLVTVFQSTALKT